MSQKEFKDWTKVCLKNSLVHLEVDSVDLKSNPFLLPFKFCLITRLASLFTTSCCWVRSFESDRPNLRSMERNVRRCGSEKVRVREVFESGVNKKSLKQKRNTE